MKASHTAGFGTAEKTWSTARTDAPGLFRLAGHLALIVTFGAAAQLSSAALYWPFAFAQGVCLVFLFCPLHETVHRTAFKTRWINDAVAAGIGFLLFLPPRWFGPFHMAHHRFTQDPERDPELATAKPTTLWRYAVMVSGAVYWRFAIGGLIGRAFGHAPGGFLDGRTRPRAIREARVMLALYALLIAGSLALQTALLLWVWIVPILLGQPMLRLYLLTEHWGCSTSRDMWENTRTMHTLAPVRYLAWNMPFHAEHHANPGVPFHQLPAFAASPDARPRVVHDGYAPFHAGRIADVAAGRAGPV